jgi:hypothetical protein
MTVRSHIHPVHGVAASSKVRDRVRYAAARDRDVAACSGLQERGVLAARPAAVAKQWRRLAADELD